MIVRVRKQKRKSQWALLPVAESYCSFRSRNNLPVTALPRTLLDRARACSLPPRCRLHAGLARSHNDEHQE